VGVVGGGQDYAGDTCSTFLLYFVEHHVKAMLCVCVSNESRMFRGWD